MTGGAMGTCGLMLAFGLACAEPAPLPAGPPPVPDVEAVLEERDSRAAAARAAAVEDALSRRKRLYRGLGECPGCGRARIDPFPGVGR